MNSYNKCAYVCDRVYINIDWPQWLDTHAHPLGTAEASATAAAAQAQ